MWYQQQLHLRNYIFEQTSLKDEPSENKNLQNCEKNINKKSSHNKKVLSKTTSEAPVKKCNCAGGVQTCPVEGECLLTDSIYEATVTAENIDTKSMWDQQPLHLRKDIITIKVISISIVEVRLLNYLAQIIWVYLAT